MELARRPEPPRRPEPMLSALTLLLDTRIPMAAALYKAVCKGLKRCVRTVATCGGTCGLCGKWGGKCGLGWAVSIGGGGSGILLRSEMRTMPL